MINKDLRKVSDAGDARRGPAWLLPRLPAGPHRAWQASDPRTRQSPGLSLPVPPRRSDERDRSHRCKVRDPQTASPATLARPFLSNGSGRFFHRSFPFLASPKPRSDPLTNSTPIRSGAGAWFVQLQQGSLDIAPCCGDASTSATQMGPGSRIGSRPRCGAGPTTPDQSNPL